MADQKIRSTGILFKNNRKERDNQPDYTGNIQITKDLLKTYIEAFKKGGVPDEGLKVDLAAWIKKGAKGPFLSVSLSAPFEKAAPSKPKDDLDGDIPF